MVTLSTIEVEYMAVAEAAKKALWLTGLVKELCIEQGGVQLHYDSQSIWERIWCIMLGQSILM